MRSHRLSTCGFSTGGSRKKLFLNVSMVDLATHGNKFGSAWQVSVNRNAVNYGATPSADLEGQSAFGESGANAKRCLP
jgi:hypothetical protein